MGWYSIGFMAATPAHIVRLEFTSGFDILDLVQMVSDRMSRDAGLDDESTHWVGVAVRECVINAITHGNQGDLRKRVFIEFHSDRLRERPELTILVRDEGDGFDPEHLADPLAPENLLRSSGRGILLIRSFMDDVQLQRVPAGGMEIRMTKRVTPADPHD
jgi:serine/threonine-protein kinase RsbW